jgi:hypothetical protein
MRNVLCEDHSEVDVRACSPGRQWVRSSARISIRPPIHIRIARHRRNPARGHGGVSIVLLGSPTRTYGVTIIAAEQTRRRCLGMELDPIYVDLVVHRWQAFTGKTAILDGDGRDFEALTQERLG